WRLQQRQRNAGQAEQRQKNRVQRRIGEIGALLIGQRQGGEKIARRETVIVPAIRGRKSPEQPCQPEARRRHQNPNQRIAGQRLNPCSHQRSSRSNSQAKLATLAARIRSAAARITSTVATGVTDRLAMPAAAIPAPRKIRSLLGTSGSRVT